MTFGGFAIRVYHTCGWYVYLKRSLSSYTLDVRVVLLSNDRQVCLAMDQAAQSRGFFDTNSIEGLSLRISHVLVDGIAFVAWLMFKKSPRDLSKGTVDLPQPIRTTKHVSLGLLNRRTVCQGI
jgi:hypothetical protein